MDTLASVRARIELLSEGTSHSAHEETARMYRALLLYQGWEGSVVLTIDGEVLEEIDGRLSPCVDPLRTVALVAGAERYPELKALLPVRADTARDCSHCKGTGWFCIDDQKTGIRCGLCLALGWVDDDV
jgi:hypothetical protein